MDETRQRAPAFTLPRLLICEGFDDIAFFQRLIAARGLPDFHIRSTAPRRTYRGGNTKFSESLEAIRINHGFPKIQDILLVTDNDDDHQASFADICDQIRQAGFEAPSAPLNSGSGKPRITVMMLPLDGTPGNLECICRDAAQSADRQTGDRTDQCQALLLADSWPEPRRGKLWLRVNLAARAHDPFVSLATVFRDPGSLHLIPLEDRSFQAIADVLAYIGSSPPDPSRPPALGQPHVPATRKRTRNPPRPRMRRPPGPPR